MWKKTMPACTALMIGLGLAGTAWSQAPTFPTLMTNRGGLVNNYQFILVCTTPEGAYDPTRRLTVRRPQGDQDSANVTVQCERK